MQSLWEKIDSLSHSWNKWYSCEFLGTRSSKI
ncbi:unnamed protein product [Schistosoma mattheei]|uniref:Uncharacterized protein n=1 Tax=Schistosoma mattheei TaxID=31246 RepID=A0A183P460_9TREM|nr:unnamed protein product [Schistosoma mattheei]